MSGSTPRVEVRRSGRRRRTVSAYVEDDHIVVLNGGEFKRSVQTETVSSSVVQGVAADPAGIGFASIFFKTKRVRALPLAFADGEPFAAPTAENVYSGKYPLRRCLWVYANVPPGTKLDTAPAEFLRFVLSSDGQSIAAADGNIPLDASGVAAGRATLGE